MHQYIYIYIYNTRTCTYIYIYIYICVGFIKSTGAGSHPAAGGSGREVTQLEVVLQGAFGL